MKRKKTKQKSEGENWKRYCPHTECPHYKGKDIRCDRTGKFCEIETPGRGLPGLYNRQIIHRDGKRIVKTLIEKQAKNEQGKTKLQVA